jgi:hypothetical protein
MRAIERRLSRLECYLLPRPETWEVQRLRERIEAARQRVAAAYGAKYVAPPELPMQLGVVERLHAGRTRARLRYFQGTNGQTGWCRNESETSGAST